MPHKTHEMYIDNIRIEADPCSDLAKLKETLDTIGSYQSMIENYGGTVVQDDKDEYETLGNTYDALKADLNSVNDTSSLGTWHASYRTANSDSDTLLIKMQKQLFEAHGTNQNKVWTYACLGNMVKVMRKHTKWLLPGQPGGSLDIKMAANEYEAGQVVLRVKANTPNLTTVEVKVSNLTCSGCPNIPASQITLHPVGYLNTQSPQYPRQYDEQWPDPILAYLENFTLEPAVWQPIWVEVHTLPNQKAGDYSGTITVTANGGHSLSIPINVKVWDFAVPHEFHFPTALKFTIGAWEKIDKYRYPTSGWYPFVHYCNGTKELSDLTDPHSIWLVNLRTKYHDMLLAHRIVPNNPYRDIAPRIDDLQKFKAAGGRHFFPLENSYIGDTQNERNSRWNKIKAFMDEFEQHPELAVMKPYIYGLDERPPNTFPEIKEICDELQGRLANENYSHKVKLITTAKDKSYGKDTYNIGGENICLDDSFDGWVPVTNYHGATLGDIAAAKARGKDIWWYTCVSPFHPIYGNTRIEDPVAALRLIPGFKAFKYKSDGFLHWTIQHWEIYYKTPPAGVPNHTPYKYTMTGGPVITVTNYTGRTWNRSNG
ncbi:MAG: hypothetical protein K8R02_00865, partial [Anaerohalosphaeraceae bacterium]|nr:hypothetical protein [Anaerohalosphaeraceae bacterium]